MKEYIGSVRFFKHLILLLCILAVAIPSAFVSGAVTKSMVTAQLAKEEKSAQKPTEDAEVHSASQEKDARLAYRDLFPKLKAEPETFVPADEQVVYLTFDDGPTACTAQILDILKEYGIKATFFVTGCQLNTEEGRALLRRIHAEGHAIGLHSDSHDYGTIYSSVEAFLKDFAAVDQKVYEITGERVKIFRFPGGSINGYNSAIYEQLIAEMLRRGYTYYDWNISAGDDGITPLSPAELEQNVTSDSNELKNGIILMHDSADKQNTVEALPRILDKLKTECQFAPITASVKPITFSYRR